MYQLDLLEMCKQCTPIKFARDVNDVHIRLKVVFPII